MQDSSHAAAATMAATAAPSSPSKRRRVCVSLDSSSDDENDHPVNAAVVEEYVQGPSRRELATMRCVQHRGHGKTTVQDPDLCNVCFPMPPEMARHCSRASMMRMLGPDRLCGLCRERIRPAESSEDPFRLHWLRRRKELTFQQCCADSQCSQFLVPCHHVCCSGMLCGQHRRGAARTEQQSHGFGSDHDVAFLCPQCCAGSSRPRKLGLVSRVDMWKLVVQQHGRCCALCRETIQMPPTAPWSLSWDRIDHALLYTAQNIQPTHWLCNAIRGDSPVEVFRFMAAAVCAATALPAAAVSVDDSRRLAPPPTWVLGVEPTPKHRPGVCDQHGCVLFRETHGLNRDTEQCEACMIEARWGPFVVEPQRCRACGMQTLTTEQRDTSPHWPRWMGVALPCGAGAERAAAQPTGAVHATCARMLLCWTKLLLHSSDNHDVSHSDASQCWFKLWKAWAETVHEP